MCVVKKGLEFDAKALGYHFNGFEGGRIASHLYHADVPGGEADSFCKLLLSEPTVLA